MPYILVNAPDQTAGGASSGAVRARVLLYLVGFALVAVLVAWVAHSIRARDSSASTPPATSIGAERSGLGTSKLEELPDKELTWAGKYGTLELEELLDAREALDLTLQRRCTLLLEEMHARGQVERRQLSPGELPAVEPLPTGVVESWHVASMIHSGVNIEERARLVTTEHPETRDIAAEIRWIDQRILVRIAERDGADLPR